MGSVVADQVRQGLKSGKSRGDLVEWFEQFGHKYSKDEQRDIRHELGLKVDTSLIPFRDLVPDGWLADLLDLQGEAESPTSFFFLAALSVMSNIIGRNVMIDRGTHELGLDISALLISPAGKGRRSTACDYVVYKIGEAAGLNVIADSFTYEHMGDQLIASCESKPTRENPRAYKPKAMLYAGEMATLLGKGAYADSIIPKLTDMLGKTTRFNWGTVKRGKIEFFCPMINALFTTSPDWLAENIPAIMFGGGTLSRFLVAVEDGPERVVTWGRKLDVAAEQRLIIQLLEIKKIHGRFEKPDKIALAWYHEWYQTHTKKTLKGEIPDERMAPYYSRKHDHLLRLTALLQIAGSGPLKFIVPRFEEALTILDHFEKNIPKAYAQMALSPIAAAQAAVVTVLKRSSGMLDHARLQKKVYRHCPLKEQFASVMESLVSMNIVKRIPNLSRKGNCYMLIGDLT